MRPEPLKDKVAYSANFAGAEYVVKIDDVKSAVEWLKEQILSKGEYGEDDLPELSVQKKFINLINEAFADVVAKGVK